MRHMIRAVVVPKPRKKDTTAPVMGVAAWDSPDDQSLTITWSANDPESAVLTYTVSVDGATPVPATSPYTISGLKASSTHTAAITARNITGLTTTVTLANMKVADPPRAVWGPYLDAFVTTDANYRVTVTANPGDDLQTKLTAAATALNTWASANAPGGVANPQLDRARLLINPGTYTTNMNMRFAGAAGMAMHIVNPTLDPSQVILLQGNDSQGSILESWTGSDTVIAGLTLRTQTTQVGAIPATMHSSGVNGWPREQYAHRCVFDGLNGYNALSMEASTSHRSFYSECVLNQTGNGHPYFHNFQPNDGSGTVLGFDQCTGTMHMLAEEDSNPDDTFMIRGGSLADSTGLFNVWPNVSHVDGGETWTLYVDPAAGFTGFEGITSRGHLQVPQLEKYPPLDKSPLLTAYYLPDGRGAASTLTPVTAASTMTVDTQRWYLVPYTVSSSKVMKSVKVGSIDASNVSRFYAERPNTPGTPTVLGSMSAATGFLVPAGQGKMWVAFQLQAGANVPCGPAITGTFTTTSTSSGWPDLTAITPVTGNTPSVTIGLG